MASPAAVLYREQVRHGSIILRSARNLSRVDLQPFYGAAFVAYVAAWNGYVVQLKECFFQETADPTFNKFSAMHGLARSALQKHFERFSTPNAENTRELILLSTGFDPWPNWQWPAKQMNGLQVRSRLNEILKVRHSFAHGFTMPGYVWNQSPAGNIRLTIQVLNWTRMFLNHLVTSTDQGLTAHLRNVYGVAGTW